MNGIVRRVYGKVRRDGLAATVRLAFAILCAHLDFRRKADYRAMLQQAHLKDRFAAIYDRNLWSSPESGSGPGSEIEFTRNLREWLVRKLPEYGVRRLADAPCGDFNWMKLVVPQLDIDYLGLDVVERVVAANRLRYGSKRISFAAANLCEDKLPDADLIMVRDCLFHLSYADVDRVLRNLARTDYKYLLTSTHVASGRFANTDIVSGDFRLIDLFSPPFGFDPARVIEAVDDYPPGFSVPRQMILVAKADVPTELKSMI